MQTNEHIMQQVLELSRKGTGYVSPNPRVGCIIIKNGVIISEGYHAKFGEAHAERVAIQKAQDEDLIGSTLYVNLEPCSHEGKTPPCADLIIAKKIAKVVVGMQDPNPLVGGRGIERLRNAGIEVEVGVLEKECRWLNRFFIKFITTGMPYVLLKAGMTLDGYTATSAGESQWITSIESRTKVHALRAELDAVLIGKKTMLADSPSLNVRHVKGRDPQKIIMDTHLGFIYEQHSPDFKIPRDTIVCMSEASYDEFLEDSFLEYNSVMHIIDVEADGKLSLKHTLQEMGSYFGISSILVEGGAEIHSSFMKQDLVDELNIFIAPTVIGKGKSIFGSYDAVHLELAKRFEFVSSEKCGDDLLLTLVKKINT